ncbi:MAG: hypothetical protein OHK0023_07810 [Anaerolineae bacterium]
MPETVQSPKVRRQGQFLAAVTAAQILITLQFYLIPYLQNTAPQDSSWLITSLLGLDILGFVFFANRIGYYHLAAYLFVVWNALSSFSYGARQAEPHLFLLLIYMITDLLIASFLLPIGVASILFVTQIGGLITYLNIFNPPYVGFANPLFTHVSLGTLIILMTHYRNLIERDRRSQIGESEERYRQLVELSPDAIVVVSDGVFVYVNPAAVTLFGGDSADQLLGRRALEHIAPEFHSVVSESVLRPRDVNLMEQRIVRLDGEMRDVEIIGSLITFQGKPARQSVIRDITQRKAAAAQSLELTIEREKTRLLEQFMSDASHDLKTPLAALKTSGWIFAKLATKIQEHASQLASSSNGTALIGTELEKIAQQLTERGDGLQGSVKRLHRVVDGMIDMARVDRIQTLDLKPGNVNQLVTLIHESFVHEVEESGCQLKLILAKFLPQVNLYVEEFLHALSHLLRNALQYTPAGGIITIRTYPMRQEVVIEVADTGIGIDPEDLPHIFKRFYRADKARSTHTGGAGLGLSVVKKIVDAHHGRLEVESILKQGTTFRILLPSAGDRISLVQTQPPVKSSPPSKT